MPLSKSDALLTGGASGAVGGPVAPTGQGGVLAGTGGNVTVSLRCAAEHPKPLHHCRQVSPYSIADQGHSYLPDAKSGALIPEVTYTEVIW